MNPVQGDFSSACLFGSGLRSLGSVVFAPFIGIHVAGEIGVITLDTTTLLIISAIFAVLALALFSMSTRTFQSEEILTKWK